MGMKVADQEMKIITMGDRRKAEAKEECECRVRSPGQRTAAWKCMERAGAGRTMKKKGANAWGCVRR